MKYCPVCDRTYADDVGVCELDGSNLRHAQSASDTLIGTIIKSRYRVIEKLGEGGMAVVYLGEQVNIERKVALKILHGQYAGDPEFVKRFRQEAMLAASLNHSNVIKVYDFDQADNGSLFIAMEYLDGENLKEVMQAGLIDVPRAVRLAIQIAEGLLSAHRAGVIHRDIKPENIMVVGGGNEIKLMDFGIARLRETGAATRLTRAGMIMGTPLYMAPEQIEGSEVTEKTDIYAFGIVLYEMLSGTVPFKAPTPAAILMKHLKELPLPLRKLRGEVPAAVEKVVSSALEKKPERRPANMEDIIESLKVIEAKFPRDEVANTLVITQPLKIVRQGSEEPRSGFGALAAKIKVVGAALFTRGRASTQGSESPVEQAPLDTPNEPWPTGGTMAETVALTQPLAMPAERKQFPWTWIGAGAVVVLLGALAFFIGRNFLDPSGDQASMDVRRAAKTPDTVTATNGKVVAAAVRGERAELVIGERMRFALSARYEDGREENVSEGVQWRSSDSSVVGIGAGGEMEARNPGRAQISARYGEVEAAPIYVRVREALVPMGAAQQVSLAILGGKAEINVGARAALRARAKYSDGKERDLKQNVRWESSNRSIAAVSSQGEMEGRKEGKATITAYFDGMPSEPIGVTVKAAIKRQEPQTAPVPPRAPDKPDVLQQVKLARSYRDRGAYSEAIAALEKARQMDPSNKDVEAEIAATRRACNAERKLGQSHLNC